MNKVFGRHLLMRLFLTSFFCVVAIVASSQTHRVTVKTNLGNMSFVLYDDTPLHRDAFLELVKENYFDGTLFYRVIENFMIQGGARDSRGAAPGKKIGYGNPDKTVNDEILPHHICRKGALCAPRQPDEINILKQSDISQFFIVQGHVLTQGKLDTMELAVNRPIRNKIINEVYPPEMRAHVKKLREEGKNQEAWEIHSKAKDDIELQFGLSNKTLIFTPEQREVYTTVGGTPEIDGEYTVFGEIVSGMDVIDKIAASKTDKNDRPIVDVVIKVVAD